MKACPACNTRYEDDVKFCSKDGSPTQLDETRKDEGLVGQVIAERYRLVRKLGEGGMGEVYIAEHVHIEKTVALKLLRPEVLSNQEAVTRFKQEARSASSIGHENIIEIDDFGTLPDGRVYLTMEYLQGAPLSDMIEQPLAIDRALNILVQTGRGLAAAHAKGIVHRDMKPENIYVSQKDGRDVVKILDFGIAKVSGNDGNQHLTRTGTIFGTPFYMSPEQALGQQIDHRADIYAMGVIMYEVFTGVVPFRAESFMGILTQHITVPPLPPIQRAAENGRSIPPELEAVILKAMAKQAPQRYQSMNEVVSALTDIYRAIAGPGLTGGYAAAPLNPSQFVPIPTSYMAAQPHAHPHPHAHTPMPAGPPQSAAYSAVYDAPQPKKGKAWMIITAIAAVVLGAGAVSWYFLAGPGKGSSSAAAANPPQAAAADAGVKKAAVVTPPPVATPDAGAKTTTGPVVTPVEQKHVVVLVDSVPRGADITLDGKKVGETPSNVTVNEGAATTFVLVKKGYEDEELVIDGTETKVSKKLDEIKKRPPPDHGGHGHKPPPDDGHKPPPGGGDDDELE